MRKHQCFEITTDNLNAKNSAVNVWLLVLMNIMLIMMIMLVKMVIVKINAS